MSAPPASRSAHSTVNFPGVGEAMRPSFGPFIRRLREQAGIGLREAAKGLGISFTRLQKIETGGRARAPELEFFRRLAGFYHQPLTTVLQEAGVDEPKGDAKQTQVDDVARFRRLVMEPSLNPHGFDEAWCETFLPLHKQQWLQFAIKLEAQLLHQGPVVGGILEVARTAADTQSTPRPRGGAESSRCLGGQVFTWQHRPAFGPWLRQIRLDADLNLRDAAQRLGLSFSMLQRMETGAKVEPTVALLWRMVWLYGISLEELCLQAGLEVRFFSGSGGQDEDERAFSALILHPDLAPEGMSSHWVETWPRRHQRQLLEFASLFEAEVLAGTIRLDSFFARAS